MLLANSFRGSVRRRRAAALAHRARRRLALESLETRVALAVSMTIDPTALGLGPNYGVWVSGSANADSTDTTNKPFKWLDSTTRQFVAPPSPTAGAKLPLLSITSPTVITFDGSNDLSGRLTIYVGAIASPPTAPHLTGTGPAWGVKPAPAAPYLTQQTITDFGTITPFDIVEFTYLHASDAKSTFNLSQVDGVGLPLTLSSTATGTSVGLQTGAGFSRAAIGDAFKTFVTADPQGTNFLQLKYGPGAASPFIQPPTVPANQFFSIVNPWYWLKNQNNQSSATPAALLSYWDATLTRFFTVGNTLSINLSGSEAPNIWEGACTLVGGVPTYTLTNVAGTSTSDPGKTFQFAKPAAGYKSAEYVFGNVFPSSVSQAGDSGLIQDNIWEALNRGVALDGVSNAKNPAATAKTIAATPKGAVMSGSGPSAWTVTITTTAAHGLKAGDTVSVRNVAGSGNQWFPKGYNGVYTVKAAPTANTFTYFIPPQGSGTPQALAASGGGTARRVGQTTQSWNGTAQWYQPHASKAFPLFTAAYNTYAKFLHYSTTQGTDSRSGGTPLFINNQAYGFGEDENPDGPYSGGEVPPKFDGTITQGSSLTLRIDPWGSSSSTSLAVVAGDFDGNGLTDVADLKGSGQWRVALTPASGTPTTVDAASPWSTAPTWSDFTVVRDATTSRDVVIARASDTVDGSWWKLSLDGGTWSTTFVGSWGIPDQWVDIVSGDFDGNGRQDIAGRWRETGEWWMLSDAAAPATTANYAAKNVQIGQWNPAASWSQVLAGNFTGDAGGKDTIAGLSGSNWWLLERTGGGSTNTLMTSGWSTAHAWADYQVGNFAGAAAGQEQIAARSASTGAWYLLGKSGSGFAISSMASWNPAANWLNVVSGDFDGDGNADIAGRSAVTGTWTVLRKSGGGFTNAEFGGGWPTSLAFAQAFAGIYNQQAGSPKKAGVLGFAVSGTGNTWWKAISNGTAFTSSAAPGYPS